MKRNKVESILLIAVLALSIQTGSYSAAITDRELDQYYAKNIQQKSTDVIVWKYRVWNGKKQKRRWNKTTQKYYVKGHNAVCFILYTSGNGCTCGG